MSDKLKIREHLRRIEAKEYLIPNFQREFIWKKARIIKLLESVLQNKPVGGLLIWRSTIPLTSKRYDNNNDNFLKSYILDGQQRLTALYIIMYGKLPYYYSKDEVELKDFKIIISLKNFPTYELYFKEKITNPENQIEISHLLSDNFKVKDIKKREHIDLYMELKNNFLTKEIFYEQFDSEDVTKAINIFHDINTSGVKLTGAELLLAYISGYWQKAREEIIKEKEKRKLDKFDLSIDMYTQLILACLVKTNNATDKTLHNKKMRDLVITCWEKITKNDGALSKTIAFFKKYKIININEIANKPSIIPIVFCHYYFELSEIEEKKLAFYFFTTQKFAYFRTNVNTRITEQLKMLYIGFEKNSSLLNQLQICTDIVKEGQILNEEFLKNQSTSSSLFFMMKWTFRNNNAVCLDKKQTIDLDSPNYPFEKDHIFPKAILKNKYKSTENRKIINEIANICFLSSKANKSKSNNSTAKFLKECKEKNPNALIKQCIPENEELWELENFELFIKNRRTLIVEAIENFINNLNQSSDNSKELEEVISIDQIMEEIISNEDDDTEFKSSLRWDYELDKKNANLEKNIIKTIAGFTNHIGGNLYIGVNDDNELLGIKKDLDIFHGSIDKFYRHLVQIIVENFDTTFFNSNIKISFPSVNKRDLLEKLDDEKKIIEEEKLLLEEESEQTKTLCLIEVKQSNELKFIKETSNSGNKIIKCYVREGPLTNLLPQDEIISYNKNRIT